MTVYEESNYLNDWLRFELDNHQSREKVTVLSGESVVMAEVVGKSTKNIPDAVVADENNTGSGTIESISGTSRTKKGTYSLTCTDATTAGSEVFEVKDPDGSILPDATVGVAYDEPQIGFTITQDAEGTDFAVEDVLEIVVEDGSGKVAPIDFTAVDGTQEAYGLMVSAVDASAADEDGVAIVRDAQIVTGYLTWPDGATDDQKAAALAQLEEKGIVARVEA